MTTPIEKPAEITPELLEAVFGTKPKDLKKDEKAEKRVRKEKNTATVSNNPPEDEQPETDKKED